MKRYPDAKVIMTVRPFEKWYASVHSTIWTAGPQTLPEKLSMLGKMLVSDRVRKTVNCVKFPKRMIFKVHFQDRFEDKAFAEEIFNRHMADVRAYVPVDKLLEYDVRDGWGPLCSFLGVPEPSEALPHLNKRENFRGMIKSLMAGNKI